MEFFYKHAISGKKYDMPKNVYLILICDCASVCVRVRVCVLAL